MKTKLKPTPSLLRKLGSIAVYTQEAFSPRGYEFDDSALRILLKDHEVVVWIREMGDLLPRRKHKLTAPNEKC